MIMYDQSVDTSQIIEQKKSESQIDFLTRITSTISFRQSVGFRKFSSETISHNTK